MSEYPRGNRAYGLLSRFVSVFSCVVNIHDNSTSNNTLTFLTKIDGILGCRTRVVTVLPKHVLL